ncbi:MAG: 2-oxoacid:acceptor oxidoreductase family protein [Proteobacteria bacterium]|nr:2-oxoacid:acceptor oxidoreductase family protein [Pseudomonadota bacterium]
MEKYYTDIVFSGSGGQGVMLIGNALSLAALDRGYLVTYMPSYGVEMRGGAANCTVVISTEEIGSPVIGFPEILVAFNRDSFERFKTRVKPGGTVIVNSTLVPDYCVERKEIKVLPLALNALAQEIGDERLMNIIGLGALVERIAVVGTGDIEKVFPKVLGRNFEKYRDLYLKALSVGAEEVRKIK